MNTVEQMKLFMEPNSIAIIGVPRQTGEGSFNILENLLNLGFQGKLYPVNPEADEILGVKSYQSVNDIPDEVDLAVIATPRPPVLGLVRECVQKGIKAMIVVAQGFADIGGEGQAMQAEMVSIAREGGARIIGPNTLGVANAFCNLSTSYVLARMAKTPVAVISQTGTFFPGLQRILASGKAIDLANACDIDFSDGLEYFEDDPDIKLIVLHMEGIQNGRRFIEVASRVTRKKPVLALKSGRSDYGARAARSHTGSLAGSDQTYDAAFKQCGIIRLNELDGFYDLPKTFLALPLMRGSRLGVVSVTGAGGVIAADACQRYGLEMARLSAETLAKIGEILPPWLGIGNPVDIWPAVQLSQQPYLRVVRRTLELVAADQGVDGIVFITMVHSRQGPLDPCEDILRVVDAFKDKPIVCWLFGLHSEEAAAYLDGSGRTVTFPTCERAVRALARLREYSELVMADIA